MLHFYSLRKKDRVDLWNSKENHGFRYTLTFGKARIEMKVGLTFACMNLKKLAKMKVKKGLIGLDFTAYRFKYGVFSTVCVEGIRCYLVQHLIPSMNPMFYHLFIYLHETALIR